MIKWIVELQTLETRVVIVLAGQIDLDLELFLNQNDIIVAVDGGANHLIETKYKPAVLIGDFDSITNTDLTCPRIKFDPVKDDTDFACALEYVSQTYPQFKSVVVGFSSLDRIDHVLTNLSIINSETTFISDNQRITLLTATTTVTSSEYKFYSFYAIQEVSRFSLSGFKYPLNSYRLRPFDPLCISNELIASSGTIEISNGNVIMIESKQS